MVREFHIPARQDAPAMPTIPSIKVQELRAKLHYEEAVIELVDAFVEGDIVKVADSIADALYVILGTAVACGIDIEPIFEEVHRSNMTKFIDGTFREDGKYVKGPNYQPADIAGVLAKQFKP